MFKNIKIYVIFFGLLFFLHLFNCQGSDFIWPIVIIDEDTKWANFNIVEGDSDYIGIVSGEPSKLFHSSNGETWDYIEQTLGGYYIWGGNKFVRFIGDKVSFSQNGIDWTTNETSNIIIGINEPIWDGTIYLCVSELKLYKSVDAITWLEVPTPFEVNVTFGVKNANNRYYIYDNLTFKEYTSHDLINWQKLVYDSSLENTNSTLWKPAYGANAYVFAAEPNVLYSQDGISWEKINYNFNFNRVAWCSVLNKFVGVKPGAGWLEQPIIYTSENGKDWVWHINRYDDQILRIYNFTDIECRGNKIIFAGHSNNRLLELANDSFVMYSQ